MRRLLLVLLVAGCAQTSTVGPYVRHVARNGDWLVIHKCVIVLEDKDLSETDCTVEQLPLAAIPQMQPQMQPQPLPPAGQPVPGQPLPGQPVPAPAHQVPPTPR